MAKVLKQSWRMKSGAVWRHAGFALYQVSDFSKPGECVERFAGAEQAVSSAGRQGKGFAAFAVYESQLGVLRAFGLVRLQDLPICIVDDTGGADPWAAGTRGRPFRRSRHRIFKGDIPAVDVSSIVAGEYAENEVRKDFTASERVAIAEAVKAQLGERRGAPSKPEAAANGQNFAQLHDGVRTKEIAAERAGFGNAETLRQASTVVKLGAPALVDKMDTGEIAIAPAAQIAKQPPEGHSKIVAMPAPSTARVVAIQGRAAAHAKALGEVLSESGRCQGPAGAERHERQRRCDAD